MAKIYVIIISFNGEEWIRKALKSVQDASIFCHPIVVDNASTDGTVDLIRAEFPNVELISLGENLGFGRGNNVGISIALSRGADYIFLLNQDAYLVDSCLERVTNFLSTNSDFDVVTPLHCSPDSSRLDIKTFKGYLRRYASDYISDACRGHPKEHYNIRGINAAAWCVRSSLFLRVGGFDPLFFMYGEDDDLISRIEFHGARFALLPDALVVHLRQSPKAPQPSRWQTIQRRASRVRSSLLLDLKTPGNSVSYMITLLLTRGVLEPISNFIVNRQAISIFASSLAFFEVLREFGRIRRHMKICERTGPHFLDMKSLPIATDAGDLGNASQVSNQL